MKQGEIKVDTRVVIKFCYIRFNNFRYKEDATLNESSSLFSTKKWEAEFKCSRSAMFDDECWTHTTATTVETIAKMHNSVLNDWELKVHMLADIEKSQQIVLRTSWIFGYDESVNTIGAIFVEGWSKTNLNEHFSGAFGHI